MFELFQIDFIFCSHPINIADDNNNGNSLHLTFLKNYDNKIDNNKLLLKFKFFSAFTLKIRANLIFFQGTRLTASSENDIARLVAASHSEISIVL